MYNHRKICQNISMIIFLSILLLVFSILLVKLKISFHIYVENLQMHIKIKFLFYEFCRSGKIKSISKKAEANKKDVNKKKKTYNKILKLRNWFLKKINYDIVIIKEQIGVLDPYITSITLPIVSTITMLPLLFLKINYKNFHYEIKPDYEKLRFSLDLKVKASFRLITLFSNR